MNPRWIVGIAAIGAALRAAWGAYHRQRAEEQRKARYAEAQPFLNHVFSQPARLRVARVERIDEMEDAFRRVANGLAGAFSLITGTKCSVCVKAIIDPSGTDEHLRVATICRDDTSLEREQGPSPLEAWIQDLENPGAVCHWIDENSDFALAYTFPGTPQSCFFSNDLPALLDYKNTSFEIYGYPPDTDDVVVRDRHWPLPYKSAIVAPIGRLNHLGISHELRGYLAVDSRSRFVFDKHYDPDVVMSVADSLFNMVDRYQELIEEELMKEPGDNDG